MRRRSSIAIVGALLGALVASVAVAGCAQILGISDPVSDACSPFDVNTCSLADTCDVDPESMLLACRPEGGLAEYALCDGVGDTCSGALTCYQGVCRQFCDSQHGCTRTGESSCTDDITVTTKVCDDDCDVLAGSGCSNGLECVASAKDSGGLIALCIPQGYFGDLASGAACDFFNPCAAGLGCDRDGDGTCKPLCTVGGGDCAGTCIEVGRLHETLDLGVCRS